MYRVIIADDEPYIVEGIKHIINWEEYGIEIAGTASNGVEALELLLRENSAFNYRIKAQDERS